jgi:hypothetical protein
MRGLDTGPPPTEVASWATRCRILVEAGLGEGESNALTIKHQDNQAETDASSTWGTRLLDSLPSRIVQLTEWGSIFDHKRGWMGTDRRMSNVPARSG